MHHQSKERNTSKSQKKIKIDKGISVQIRFNEVRINKVPLYIAINTSGDDNKSAI